MSEVTVNGLDSKRKAKLPVTAALHLTLQMPYVLSTYRTLPENVQQYIPALKGVLFLERLYQLLCCCTITIKVTEAYPSQPRRAKNRSSVRDGHLS